MRARFRRSQEQRIVILSAEGDVKKVTITIQGTTDTYEIVAQPQSLTCSCPDAEIRKCVCKHQCVVLSRVLQVDFPDPLYSEPALTEAHMVKLVTRLATWLQPNKPEEKKEIKRKVLEKDDECPICIDPLDDASPLTWCSSQCGQNFHLTCLRNCLKTRENCPLCRALIKLTSLPDSLSEEKPKKIRKRKHIQDT